MTGVGVAQVPALGFKAKVLLDALALAHLLLYPLSPQFCGQCSHAPLLGDLAPHYAVDLDAPVGNLRAGRRNAHKLPSIVGGVRHEAGHHLVTCSYLVLDDYVALGEGCVISRDRPLVALAIGFLAGQQFIMVDEVGGQHLVYGVQVPVDYCLLETADQCHVPFRR
jgi:hypothetical protein